ncbi:hypothetical protein [Streptomyces poonensis]|uniref:Uncharacterized protein n=1 Tax=Streptomyces poonensis TaxID=68255 RepID=A0A918P7N4_9ACTN|nr:hypothetical protein [Streptomyces poonensis]GGY88399.1 hypothetical protein GCM10010365_03060 [Streptomyces poonensis]GLJ92365.1 hypothetical protein GCM10017589_49740 [Streptomyces poonensis]
MSDYVIRSGDRAAFLAGLRELVDFLTAHPTAAVPRGASVIVLVDASDSAARRDGVESVAAPLGMPTEDVGRGYFDARREFGPISYSVIGVPPKERQ